jgi:hypothetical protein
MASGTSPLRQPRGRLPARVYWFRRALVAGVAVALVAGFAQLLGGGGDGDDGTPTARLAGAAESSTDPTPQVAGPVPVVTTGPGKGRKKRAQKSEEPASTAPAVPLAEPDGPCEPADITVDPKIEGADAGRPVTIDLRLTATRPACTFEVSPKALAVKVTSGSDFIWSTQDCKASVPRTSVVVRSAEPTSVPVEWNGRRSDAGCGVTSDWARPGYYHAVAAVIGSEPTDVQFQLSVPSRPVVTKTAHPRNEKKDARPEDGADDAAGTGADDNGVQGKGTKCGGDNAASSC